MFSLPVVVGLIEVTRESAPQWYLGTLILTWVIGYFAFNAATVWLKSPPARRGKHLAPVLTYGAITVGFGLVTLAWGGWQLLWWAVVFAPLIGGALWLAATHRDRTLLSGGLTVVAAALMVLVIRFGTPDAVIAAWGTPALARTLALASLVFTYLFGTVFYVKTMIRERGDATWLAASLIWHGSGVVLAAALAATQLVGWVWPVFFLAALARAALVPWFGRVNRVKPLTIGVLEIGITAAFILASFIG